MAVVALATIHVGAWAFGLCVAAGAAVLCWEWARLCYAGGLAKVPGQVLLAAILIAIALAVFGRAEFALAAVLAAAVVVYVLGMRGEVDPTWMGAGALYIGLPTVALVWLRGDVHGEAIVLWLMLSVWATDTGAFFVGRAFGGPRLAPRISPKKTWAGLVGAMASAGAVGAIAGALCEGAPRPAPLAAAGAVLAVVAQMGDLGESWVKRRFGAKDSSHLIPGHGGLFDRVDGLLAAAVLVAAWQLATDGGGILAWR